jgi:phage-related minor tail protein
MLHRALIIGLVASSTALHLKQQPVMKLRGGLAGLDADQVSKVVMGISAANAGVMALAPTKAGEMYGVKETKWTNFFAQWAGLMMFGQTLTAFLAAGGMDMAEALGWGFIPGTVAAVQDFLNNRNVGELGMSDMAKYMPPLVNILLNLGLMGKLSFLDADLSMKIACVWMGLNGLAGYFATDKWMEGWGASALTAVEAGMGKLFASTMAGGAAYIAANQFFGKSVLESFGVMMGLYARTSIDGVYISKTMDSMGVEPAKALFWAAIQALTAGVIFL